MKVWQLNQITNEEKSDILSKHRHIYDGYRTINPSAPSKEQPLYVQDFAKDKEGMTLNNKGNIKKYTNVSINESKEEVCNECGGKLYEGECTECGYNMNENECTECGKEMYEDDCMECGSEAFEGIHDVKDLDSKKSKFDYIEDDFKFEPMESAWADEEKEGEIDEWMGAVARAAVPAVASYVGSKLGDSNEEIDEYFYNDEDEDEFPQIGMDKSRMDRKPKMIGSFDDEHGWYDEEDYQVNPGDFEDYDEEEFDDFDTFYKKHGQKNNRWFNQSSKKMFDKYKSEYNKPFKVRTIKDKDFEEVDTDLKESLKKEKSRILEMMNRMNVI